MEECSECGYKTDYLLEVVYDEAGRKHTLCRGCAEKVESDC